MTLTKKGKDNIIIISIIVIALLVLSGKLPFSLIASGVNLYSGATQNYVTQFPTYFATYNMTSAFPANLIVSLYVANGTLINQQACSTTNPTMQYTTTGSQPQIIGSGVISSSYVSQNGGSQLVTLTGSLCYINFPNLQQINSLPLKLIITQQIGSMNIIVGNITKISPTTGSYLYPTIFNINVYKNPPSASTTTTSTGTTSSTSSATTTTINCQATPSLCIAGTSSTTTSTTSTASTTSTSSTAFTTTIGQSSVPYCTTNCVNWYSSIVNPIIQALRALGLNIQYSN